MVLFIQFKYEETLVKMSGAPSPHSLPKDTIPITLLSATSGPPESPYLISNIELLKSISKLFQR